MIRISTTFLALLIAALSVTAQSACATDAPRPSGTNWDQPAGPNGNWKVGGSAPTEWSVVRNENILWRTPLPECGQSNVTVWGALAFTTIHKPLITEDEKDRVTDVVGYCLNAHDGRILWNVDLPGSVPISLNGGFSDGTVFGPICDGEHVWFFNRCGSMGCFDLDGNRVWFRAFTPRYKHNNRQFEPFLLGDTLIYVEVLDKQLGSKIQKWKADGRTKNKIVVPQDPEIQKRVWCYVHGIDKLTGEIRWREPLGVSIHCTATLGRRRNGEPALVYARGGFHRTLEKPYGFTLMNLSSGHEGEPLWSTAVNNFSSPSFNLHWDERYVVGFTSQEHFVLDTKTGKPLRYQSLSTAHDLWTFDPTKSDWTHRSNAPTNFGSKLPCTYHSNILVGDHHYFRTHRHPYLVRCHVVTGKTEVLELPAQIRANPDGDELLWGRGMKNRPVDAQGFAVGDKGHNGIGWGHLSAASPTLVGRHLFVPLVTGTVCVIDTSSKRLNGSALTAVNDLGPAGVTGTWASLSFANGRLYARTMREIICIGK
ncbi:MAG: hypothetical protein ABGZ35_21920 [Planctomycetaceae bacterium]